MDRLNSLQLYGIMYKKSSLVNELYTWKQNAVRVAAAVLNLFLIASLNMPSAILDFPAVIGT